MFGLIRQSSAVTQVAGKAKIFPAPDSTAQPPAATTAAAGLIREDYVKVDPVRGEENEKSDVPSSKDGHALMARMSLVRDVMSMRAKGVKKDTYALRLAMSLYSLTSGAAAASAPAATVVPGSSDEFASLANLFDEYTVVGGEVFYRIFAQNTSNTSGAAAAFAYDPINAGAYSSVQQVLPAQQCTGPVSIEYGITGSSIVPSPVSPTGWYRKRFVCPKGPQIVNPNSTSNYVSGQWVSTGSTAAIFGTFKGYVDALSAGTTTVQVYILADCRFRCRT